LLEEVSGFDGARFLRELDSQAPPGAAERLDSLVQRRLSGEPLQHVLGHWAFRELDVVVDSRVLVPRPETEVVVTVALSEVDRLCALQAGAGVPAPGAELRQAGAEVLVVDLGTGSGVIALSLAVERAMVRVIATDRDPAALEVASGNLSGIPTGAAARVQFCQGDWYHALPLDSAGQIALIVANPPYLAEHEWAGLDPTVRSFDPIGALVAGPSGLEAIESIVAGAPTWLGRRGALVVEIASDQAGPVLEMARGAGFPKASVEYDLAGRPRVLVAEL
jgi:release factor glutamine methyltransferase